jgi:hypothetical protein
MEGATLETPLMTLLSATQWWSLYSCFMITAALVVALLTVPLPVRGLGVTADE